MQHPRSAWIAIALCLFMTAGVSAQSPPPAPSIVLSVTGEVEKPLKLSAPDLSKLPRHAVRAKGHDGKEAEFEGVPLVEVLKLAGIKFGEELRGKNLALYLLAEAPDGYKVVYALAEMDPVYNDRLILLADKRDGKPLDGNEGPLRIVVPGEKRQSRWIRQVNSLVIKRAP